MNPSGLIYLFALTRPDRDDTQPGFDWSDYSRMRPMSFRGDPIQ